MNKTSPSFEKLFLKYVEDMGETSGGFIGIVNPEIIEEGNPKKIGDALQRGADILENRLEDIEFQPYEYEKGKTKSRLKEALNVLREMGKEIESRTTSESKEYHWYIIAITMDIISSFFNHIEIYLVEHSR